MKILNRIGYTLFNTVLKYVIKVSYIRHIFFLKHFFPVHLACLS